MYILLKSIYIAFVSSGFLFLVNIPERKKKHQSYVKCCVPQFEHILFLVSFTFFVIFRCGVCIHCVRYNTTLCICILWILAHLPHRMPHSSIFFLKTFLLVYVLTVVVVAYCFDWMHISVVYLARSWKFCRKHSSVPYASCNRWNYNENLLLFYYFFSSRSSFHFITTTHKMKKKKK